MKQFRAFLASYKPIYDAFRAEDGGFQLLEQEFSATVMDDHDHDTKMKWKKGTKPVPFPSTLQFSFGARPYGQGRMKFDDLSTAVEKGGSLVYSPGVSGNVAVILYPAQGDLAGVAEKIIILRNGYFSERRLLKGLRRDLADLVAYTFVTSIDASATWGQRLRVWWLRKSRPRVMNEQKEITVDGLGFGQIAGSFAAVTGKTIIMSALVASMKPIGVLVAILAAAAFTRYGFFDWFGVPSPITPEHLAR